MFGGMAFKVGMLAKKGGTSSDIIPDAINWGNLDYNGIIGEYTYAEKQITGINQTITIKVTQSTPSVVNMYYAVNAPIDGNYDRNDYGDLDGRTTIYDYSIFGLTPIDNNETFTVNNNDWICFGCDGSNNTAITITVKNNSDGDSTLDTFTATVFTI